jgi:hypothetical protein
MRRGARAGEGVGATADPHSSATSAPADAIEPAPRRRRGRILARIALVLGVLALVAAPVLRFWVAPALAQAPAVPGGGGFVTFTEVGTLTALFDLEDAEAATTLPAPVPITRTITTRGDAVATSAATAAGLNVAVTDTVDRIVTDDGRLIAEIQFRLAADRHTQALADCCGVGVSGSPAAAMAGAGSPLRLPWSVPASTYPAFDPVLLAPVPMAAVGSEPVAGRDALKFQQTSAPTAIGTVPVPGRLVSSEQPTVELTRARTVTRTLWVDPTTGIILRTAERAREALRDTAGRDVVTLVTYALASTPEQEAIQAARADVQGQPVRWASVYGPAIAVAAAMLLLLLGTVLVVREVRASRVEEDFPDELATFEDLRETFDRP